MRLEVKSTAGSIYERYGRCRISSSVTGTCRKGFHFERPPSEGPASISGSGASHRDLFHKLEKTVEPLARDRHLVEYGRIELVLQPHRLVPKSGCLLAIGHPALGGAQAVRQQDGESAIKAAGKGVISRELS